ncbi:FAD-dependent oxidoreductase [Acidisoma cellulosilytica]|uniref:FAD-dependent oxidoreductase n=1 Tax=Acidisoma cellulosilyticum TaxID=2802395 RepID=A0A964E3I6_9PROT|nr:FAD-dependent oxidoreductase [Acidisoma cellulosilyticum]MCB8879978.1 FAD-dependent oxidoreductase [Acidisoma cellulosilyticum]
MEDEDVVSDFHAIGEKHTKADEHAEIVVIGAGAAGLAAAITAAKAGAQVMLVDENPLGAGLIGMDVPLLFGNRWTAAVQNQGRMLEQVLTANPGLEEAFELGIDVKLGTYAWGAFTGGPNLRSLPEPVVGLADETRSWIVGFRRLIIATGARDLVYAFKGFETPGVVGALGLTALIQTYASFNGQRIVILGTGDLAVATATMALDAGYDVAALVEVRDTPQADVSALIARGVEIVTGHAILEALGNAEGVTAALLAPVAGGETRSIACDTICLAVGAVPVIDLADVAGAKIARNEAGAFVPGKLPAGVFVTGDAAGLGTDAAAAGVAAATAALASLGHDVQASAVPSEATALPADTDAYRMDWMRALMTTGGQDVIACSCEEVSRRDLLDVQPPRYLAAPTDKHNSLKQLAEDGPVSQDQIKRLTRACMGPCQARRCREQVAMIMAIGTDRPLGSIALAGYRAPVRPLPLGVLAAASETPGMVEGWNVWFGIRTQWIPYDDIGTEREAERAGRMAHF